MNYKEWLEGVPEEITEDALWRMELCRYALFLTHLAWFDTTKLAQDKRTISVANQLYRAVGSISANISEGYGRGSKKDQARFYEYALGSARESRDWYYQGRHVLGEQVVQHRLKLVASLIRQLLATIPRQRGYKIRDEEAPYETTPLDTLLTDIPFQ